MNAAQEAFFSYCEPEPNTGCWYYVGPGKGSRLQSGTFPAEFRGSRPRCVWRLFQGEVPAGLQINHTCESRRGRDNECVCVNPDHLYLAARADVYNGPKVIVPPVERFWSLVNKDGPVHPVLGTACWLWTGTASGPVKHGQFRLTTPRRVIQAHRFSYELHNGPVPDGLYVCHHCDVPRCVRPDHLFAGTAGDNVRDMVAKGRHRSARKTNAA